MKLDGGFFWLWDLWVLLICVLFFLLFFLCKVVLKKKFFILMVVICSKTQEIVDGYIVLLGIMGCIIYLFLFKFHLLVFLFDGVG